ncbi:MAG: hypothetical protein M3083_00640 [Actinomycetota bacterium]|nr:hypothetical protein [Actinomycetota bacterium]MDQ6945089.1 hypothetical protein [Actinomycetota bacterium]
MAVLLSTCPAGAWRCSNTYTAALGAAPLNPTRRAYVSKVRQYLAWLAAADVDGDHTEALTAGTGRCATYRNHRRAVLKHRPGTVTNAYASSAASAVRGASPPTRAWGLTDAHCRHPHLAMPSIVASQ